MTRMSLIVRRDTLLLVTYRMGDVEIYNAIKSVCPEYLDEFKRISDLEIEVNKSFNKRLMAVSEALHADWDTKSIIKKLRLFVYNVPYGQSLPVNEKTAYMCEVCSTFVHHEILGLEN